MRLASARRALVRPIEKPLELTRPCPPPAGVGEADWVFKTTFAVAKDELKKDSHELVFEGLDTFCTVFLVRPLPASTRSRARADCDAAGRTTRRS